MRSNGSLSVLRPALALAPAMVGLLWLGGCTDQQADERAAVHTDIASARAELSAAYAGQIRPGADGYDAARQKMESAVTKLKGISGGSKGQQGAKQLLTATALQELATMDINAMDVVMEDINRLRVTAEANTRAAQTLTALAEARVNLDLTDERAQLDDAGTGTQRQLTEVNAQINELTDPISEREQQNQQDRARVAELRDRAEDLYRQADTAGAADGLSDFLDAQDLMRQADKLERAISDRMIELDYNYAAEHARMTSRTAALRAQLEAVGTARSDLDKLVQSLEADGAASRTKAQELAGAARDALNELNTRFTNDLLPLYESATRNLNDAATQAQSAAGNLGSDSTKTARIAKARVLATLGQVHYMHAASLDRQIQVVRQLGSMPDMQSVASQATGLQEKRDAAMTSATQAFTDARDAVASAGGGAGDAASLQRHLDEMVSRLTGTEMPAPTSITPPAGDGQPSAGAVRPPSGASGGFASPQALVDAITRASGGDVASNQQLARGITASTASGQAMVQLMRTGTELHEAVVDQFGVAAAQSMDQNVSFQSAELVEETPNSATVRLTMDGAPAPVEAGLVNQNGSWYLNVDDLAAATPGFETMVPMVDAMNAAIEGVTDRVKNGDFSSANEVMQAIQVAIVQAMQPPGGGN